jgi:wyosine [tRNA(Phe)-imidazoG37] synthetase (radical SAM superfamily)
MAQERLQILIADSKGRVYNLPSLEAIGMKGNHYFRLTKRELVKLPFGSELFMLPDRAAVGYDVQTKSYVVLDRNPFFPKNKKCFAVAAFISPGFTVTYNSAYVPIAQSEILPLFSYAAVAFYKGDFYVTALRIDRQLWQDLRYMDITMVRKNINRLKKLFAHNRLIKQLSNCALIYGCPAAKNFFLSRYEAPLPTSPFCNARCIGCISCQPKKRCSVAQPRINFVPHPEEIAELALFHIENVQRDPVVSFGQGCEGEPLLVADVLEESIKLIRKRTNKGIININTNASKPRIIAKLFAAGLDSIRVSLNSARKEYYTRYFKPKSYTFEDVIKSIKIAKKNKGFVSINYLTVPGFTDSLDEFMAFRDFLGVCHIDMIQWRNLNFDPLSYFRELKISIDNFRMLGIRTIIDTLKETFPHLMMGYFNPSRLRIKRHNSQLVRAFRADGYN